ncbi:MAG: hypothetical protein KU37_03995 [Sulfuricurvum sp. PC08-66]|nr:MAG: hypothetical protein KU37_03995 [Sulfuricurvum sp. PC08-66]
MKTPLITLSIVAFLWVGCGDTSAPQTYTGQLVDSYIQNANYTCADGTKGITDANGTFSCQTAPVQFHLNALKLGEIATLPTDGQVFPQELLGLSRNDTNDSRVIAMARFLQSCDDDNRSSNGIRIRESIKEVFQTSTTFDASEIENYVAQINTQLETNITLISTEAATAHLEASVTLAASVKALDTLPPAVVSALLSPQSQLSQEVLDALAYMLNEERLAYDIYNYLYAYHNDSTLKQLTNIATKSESTHIQSVQLLVKKYAPNYDAFTNIDLTALDYVDTTLGEMNASTYDINAIQTLYTTLVTKGKISRRDALEVGCMVEVTDINDLNEDINLSKASNAADVTTVFEFLRDASYTHYWAFDKALKAMGVTNGCCGAGESYCHPEYPNVPQGQGKH